MMVDVNFHRFNECDFNLILDNRQKRKKFLSKVYIRLEFNSKSDTLHPELKKKEKNF